MVEIRITAALRVAGGLLACCVGCFGGVAHAEAFYPAYPGSNARNWVLDDAVSDEFEGAQIDESKWFIQGTGGVFQSNFRGVAPAQFSPDNARVEDGKLKIQSRWEPDYDFWPLPDSRGRPYENITSAAVISKEKFHFGYMEVKAKAADASVTSAWWALGNQSELDMFEFFGKPKQAHKVFLEKQHWSSIHDWSVAGGPTTWTDTTQLDFRVADDFHVYGVDWNPEYLSFHVDGEHLRTVTRDEVEAAYPGGWRIENPLAMWFSSTTFPWHGLPVAGDLPADFEVEYIRVWQDGGLHGDYNASGQVEQGDLDLVLGNWGVDSTGNIPAGWINDLPQGQIEQTELDGVLGNWGATSAPDFSDSAVPEPATLALLALSGLALRRRRGGTLAKPLEVGKANGQRGPRGYSRFTM